MIKKSSILFLALLTLVVFPVIGYFIIYFFSDLRYQNLLLMPQPIWQQAGIGIIYGCITAYLAILILKFPFFQVEIEKYQNMIKGMNLNFFDIIFISICAGIGEELLFRVSIQPLFGIIITSILFVALHGYLNPFNWRVSIYGIYLSFVIVGIAYLYEFSGVVAIILAHTVIDIILLRFLNK